MVSRQFLTLVLVECILSQHATHPQPVLCIPASTDINRTGSGLADYKENAAFSDKDLGGIRNIARRAILSLERIAFDDDPLRLLLIETSYQPFISLFSMLSTKGLDGQLSGIPNYASALSFEIIRGPAPEFRDFVRLKFKNGAEDAKLQTLHIFDHPDDWFPFEMDVTTASQSALLPFRVLLVPLVVAVFAFAAYRTQTRSAKRHDAMRQNEEQDTFVKRKVTLASLNGS